jgi:hypothetical protein
MPSALRARRRLLAVALALAAPLAAAADVIDPDRPDLTDSASTVGRGVWQIEAGLEYARTSLGGSPVERRLTLETVLRVGLAERLEVRLEGEPLVRLRGVEDDTGHGDLTLGLKYRFLDAREGGWPPALGVLPFVKLPLADAPIGSERPDFGARLLAGFELPGDFGLDANAGLAAIGQTRPSGYLVQGLVSAALQRALLPERLQAFAELFFLSREERDGRHRLGADVGLVYRLTPTLAVDAALETTLAGQGPDYAVRAGLSTRFGGGRRR